MTVARAAVDGICPYRRSIVAVRTIQRTAAPAASVAVAGTLCACAWRWRTTTYLSSLLVALAALALYGAVRIAWRSDWWGHAAAFVGAAGLGLVGILYLVVGLPDVDRPGPHRGGLVVLVAGVIALVPAVAGLRSAQR